MKTLEPGSPLVNQEMYKRFEEAGIPYFEIDKEMLPLIDVLNFDLGLKTKYCCYGHKDSDQIYVIFDESVSEQKILDLIYKRNSWTLPSLWFYKWYRPAKNKILVNWKAEVPHQFHLPKRGKQEFMNKLVESLKSLTNKGDNQ